MAYGEFAKIYDELINEDIDYDKIAKRIKDISEEQKIQIGRASCRERV